ncbi:MAG: hypothetical protein ABIQ44_11470 [Chloroflexia bacterium]
MTASALARPLASFFGERDLYEFKDITHGLAALPRGTICEILGTSSTGRTALAHSMLATATLGGEVVAVVDSNDTFDPASAQRAGADLGKLLWVQCRHRLETALRATDMILNSGGFGLILLDLCDVSPIAFQRVPSSYWYRFRRTIENTPSLLLILSRQSVAKSCAVRQFELRQQTVQWRGIAPFQTMQKLAMEAASRKPMGLTPVDLEARAESFVEL